MSDYLDLRELAEEYADLKERDTDGALDEEGSDRLAALKALEEQLFTDTMAEYADNESTMIEDIDFEDYAREFAEDVGYMPRSDHGRERSPLFDFIDWEDKGGEG